MSELERVFGDGSPGTKAEFTLLLSGVRTHMIDRTIEERHNVDGSTDWCWEFEGATSGWLTCHHEPKEGGTQITTDFEFPGARQRARQGSGQAGASRSACAATSRTASRTSS